MVVGVVTGRGMEEVYAPGGYMSCMGVKGVDGDEVEVEGDGGEADCIEGEDGEDGWGFVRGMRGDMGTETVESVRDKRGILSEGGV